MKTIKLIVIASLIGLLAGSCCYRCNYQKRHAPQLQGVVWKLIQFDKKDVVAENQYEISFLKSGRVAGVGACNRFFGPYEILNNNGGLTIGPVASTLMACPGENIEAEYFRMLEEARLYQIDGINLYMFVNDKVKAVFVATDKPVEENAQN